MSKPIGNSEKSGVLAGLRYALEIVQNRRIINRTAAYLAALDDMEIFLSAAIDRVERGECMHSTAVVSQK